VGTARGIILHHLETVMHQQQPLTLDSLQPLEVLQTTMQPAANVTPMPMQLYNEAMQERQGPLEDEQGCRPVADGMRPEPGAAMATVGCGCTDGTARVRNMMSGLEGSGVCRGQLRVPAYSRPAAGGWLVGRTTEAIVITVGGVDTYYDYDERQWKHRRLGGGPIHPKPAGPIEDAQLIGARAGVIPVPEPDLARTRTPERTS
jgi:hypothetical protein